MMLSIHQEFRQWQKSSTGDAIFQHAKQEISRILDENRPNLVVQIEGRSYVEHYPENMFYYHVSEDANIEARGYSIEAEQGFLPFPDQSVDVLIIGHAFELYQNQQGFVMEVERVLSAKGVVVITALLNRWLGTIPKQYHPLGDLHVAPKSIRSIRKRLATVDLQIVEEKLLVSDTYAAMMSERLKETIIYPVALKVQRQAPSWISIAGVSK